MTAEEEHRSYDYATRRGARWLSWPDFAAMAATLAERLQPLGIEAVVGIARAGLFPATAVACALRRDLYPARVTRREQDVVSRDEPVWKTPVSCEVRGKLIAAVDEIADSGRTLALAAEAVHQAGAGKVVTAALVAHAWARPQPDVVALVSNELLVFPWDRRVLVDGEWRLHPELVGALTAQGLPVEDPGVIDYESLAGDYARHRRLHPGVLRALLEGGAVAADSRVLEVGCGTGNYVGAMGRLTGCTAFGVDPAAAMLSQARETAACSGLCRGRAEALPFAPASLDLVYSVDVIHHVGDLAAYHEEAARLLRPGARFCTVTDSEEIIRGRVPLSRYFPETVAVELARYPRVEALLKLMAIAGLRDLRGETVEATYAVTSSEPYRSRAYSSLVLIDDEALRAGVARLDADLARGPVMGVARYVLLWGSR